MKSMVKTLLLISITFVCTFSFAQNLTFTTPEGIKWGMSISEVKKLKIDAPLSTQQDRVIYHDLRKGDETYFFENDKLVKIFSMRTLYSKKELNNYFDEVSKEICSQYGLKYTETDGDKMNWVINNTNIQLSRNVSKKGGVIMLTYSPL